MLADTSSSKVNDVCVEIENLWNFDNDLEWRVEFHAITDFKELKSIYQNQFLYEIDFTETEIIIITEYLRQKFPVHTCLLCDKHSEVSKNNLCEFCWNNEI